jgi:hypothetical protein
MSKKYLTRFLLVCAICSGCSKDTDHQAKPVPKPLSVTNVYETHYANGQRHEYGVFIDSMPIGVHRMWDKKGNLVSSGIHSNGCRWYGTFYMLGAGDWFDTYTNGVLCSNMVVDADLSDYKTWLYSYNGSYKRSRELPETIEGHDRRAKFAMHLDWSDFPGFINYEEKTTQQDN